MCVCVRQAAYITYRLHAALVSAAKVMRCIQCCLSFSFNLHLFSIFVCVFFHLIYIFMLGLGCVAVRRRFAGSVNSERMAPRPRSWPLPRPVYRKRLGPYRLSVRHGRRGSGRDRSQQCRRSYKNTSQHCSAQERLTTASCTTAWTTLMKYPPLPAVTDA